MEEHKIIVKGRKVNYKSAGSGPCMVLLHGIPTHSGLWHEMMSYLEKAYSLFAFDLLGFGESDKPDSSELDIKSQAAFFLRVFEELSLKNIVIVGHDIGGGIAQIMAVSNPSLFKAMILIDTACYDSWPIKLLSTEKRLQMLFQHMPAEVLHETFIKYIMDGLYYKGRAHEVAEKYWKYIENKEGADAFLRLVDSLSNKYTSEVSYLFHNIRIPSLIIWGKNDIYIRMSYGYRLSEDIRNSTICIFDDAGHFLPEDQPEKAAREIDRFVERISE